MYLSPVYTSILPQYRHRFGYMLSLRAIGNEEGATRYPWMLDNGAFGGKWDADTWMRRLDDLAHRADTCIAAVVPDVVADVRATLARWHQYAPVVKQAGYRTAFVAQDGLTPDMVPWHELDVLFVGGTTRYKLHGAWSVIREAQGCGVWVHVGRVNSTARLRMFGSCDSADGTMLAREPSQARQEQMLWTCEEIARQKDSTSLFS